MAKEMDGVLKFTVGETEVMRFEVDGSCFIQGQLVGSNEVVYETFKQWLEMTSNHKFDHCVLCDQNKEKRIAGLTGSICWDCVATAAAIVKQESK